MARDHVPEITLFQPFRDFEGLPKPLHACAADDFHALGDLAAQRGIRVGHEALAWGRHVNDHRDAGAQDRA